MKWRTMVGRFVFRGVLGCFEGFGGTIGEFNWEKGNLCGMEGFGWRRRESGKKLNVMSGYEWCEWKCVRANGTRGARGFMD